jgi:mono/diheme cytochrome c family protein
MIPRLSKSCLCFALLALAASADAAYPRYSAPSCGTYGCPTYSQPASYSYSYGPTYSAWTYRVYPGTEYFYRVRNVFHGGYGYAPQVEHDGYLYTLHGGCYAQHCLIADYLNRPAVVLQPAAKLAIIGTADYGVDPLKYAVAKAYGTAVAGILQQQYPPSAVDVGALLPPATTERPARLEAALKTSNSATEALRSIAMGDQENERRESEARRQLALQANKLQSFERMLGKFNEMAAVADQQATFSANAIAPQIQVGDPQLAQLIGTSCFQCHGGGKTEAGLDFKLAGSFDALKWRKIVRAVVSGAMPKGGQPLGDEQLALFEDQYDRARKAQP